MPEPKGVRYEMAWRWFRDGKIKGRRVGKHIILIEEDQEHVSQPKNVVVYARVSDIYSFCARLYGQRRAKHKTERIVEQLEKNGDDDAIS